MMVRFLPSHVSRRCAAATEHNFHRAKSAVRIRFLQIEQGCSTRRFSLMAGISKTHLMRLDASQASPELDMPGRIAARLNARVAALVSFE